ncbi:MAG: heme-binding protein [Bacteroidia bacterium]
MKAIFITLGIVLLIFIIIQAFAMSNRSSIEEYSYKVVETYDGFEIREYEASLFTSVKMATNKYEQASSAGFRVLAGYIFGNNSESQKIAMTSPVAMTMNDSMTMMFMVPKNIEKDELPKPNDSRIILQEEPAKTVAAIRFSGWANNNKLEKYKKKLSDLLEIENIAHTGNFMYLGYNPPYDVVNRKNEVIVEILR